MECFGYLPLLVAIDFLVILLIWGVVKVVRRLRAKILERKRRSRSTWFDEPGDS